MKWGEDQNDADIPEGIGTWDVLPHSKQVFSAVLHLSLKCAYGATHRQRPRHCSGLFFWVLSWTQQSTDQFVCNGGSPTGYFWHKEDLVPQKMPPLSSPLGDDDYFSMQKLEKVWHQLWPCHFSFVCTTLLAVALCTDWFWQKLPFVVFVLLRQTDVKQLALHKCAMKVNNVEQL